MFKHKNITFFFFFIFSLFWSPCAHTMNSDGEADDFLQRANQRNVRDTDDDDDMLKFLPGHNLSSVPVSEGRSLLLIPNEDETLLEAVFGPMVTRVRVPESARQIISGLASLIPLFPTGQVFVPLSLIGLNSLGLTKYIVPDVGWESWILVGSLGLPIAKPVCIATYSKVSKLMKPTSSELTEIQKKKVFERPLSSLESWSQSYATQFIRLAFWEFLFSALIFNTESRVTGWGDYRILGGIFTALALIPIYFIYVYSSNNMGKYSYRSYKNKDEETQKKASLEPIEAAKEYIKDNGLNNEISRCLAQLLSVVEMPLPSNTMLSRINNNASSETDERRSSAHLLEERGQSSDLMISPQNSAISQFSQLDPIENLAKPTYQKAFEKMIAIKRTTSPKGKNWNTKSTEIAKYLSRIIQLGSIPAEAIIPFALPYLAFNYYGPYPWLSWTAGIASTAIYTLLYLPGISARENALIWREYEQLLRLYKPQVTCGYLGERIAPWVARGCTLLYFTFPLFDFIKNSLLQPIGITNVPLKYAILVPFMGGIGFAAPSQFLDSTYTTLANWFATRGCCSRDRMDALETVERLQEMENNTFQLNPTFTKILTDQLGITPASEESSHLSLENSSL